MSPVIDVRQRTDQLPFPVEWSARVTIEDAGRVAMAMRRNIQRLRSQKDHYEHEQTGLAASSRSAQERRAAVFERVLDPQSH